MLLNKSGETTADSVQLDFEATIGYFSPGKDAVKRFSFDGVLGLGGVKNEDLAQFNILKSMVD